MDKLFLDSDINISEEQKKSKKLEKLFQKFKSNAKIKEFVEMFKEKMKTHMKTKPKQEVKSFLSNFKNLLDQHKSKFWKQAKIDLVEDNYDQFAVFVIKELLNDRVFI